MGAVQGFPVSQVAHHIDVRLSANGPTLTQGLLAVVAWRSSSLVHMAAGATGIVKVSATNVWLPLRNRAITVRSSTAKVVVTLSLALPTCCARVKMLELQSLGPRNKGLVPRHRRLAIVRMATDSVLRGQQSANVRRTQLICL